MEEIVNMDKCGRLVLSKRIRRAINLAGPTRFKVQVVTETLLFTPLLERRHTITRSRNALLVVSTGSKRFNAAEAVEKGTGGTSVAPEARMMRLDNIE